MFCRTIETTIKSVPNRHSYQMLFDIHTSKVVYIQIPNLKLKVNLQKKISKLKMTSHK